MIANGISGVILAYLLGSIPAAYIVTRLKTRQDIRRLGSGNAGAHNVYREVGFWPAVIVAIFDVGKGAIAVFFVYWLLGFPSMRVAGLPQAFVLLAALAVVAGHMWSIYLRFTGGNGLSPTIGALTIVMPGELIVALALTLVLIVVTRNVGLSVNISLLIAVPLLAWFWEESWLFAVFIIIMVLVLVLHFLPTARAALAEAEDKGRFVAELLRVDRARGSSRRKRR